MVFVAILNCMTLVFEKKITKSDLKMFFANNAVTVTRPVEKNFLLNFFRQIKQKIKFLKLIIGWIQTSNCFKKIK
jgi:hypothetical protein